MGGPTVFFLYSPRANSTRPAPPAGRTPWHLEDALAGAYRGKRLMAFNPRILAPTIARQRSRSAPLRSPLSRKPFGDLPGYMRSIALALLFAILGLDVATAQDDYAKPIPCPASVKLTSVEIVRSAIPDYEKKLARSAAKLADAKDEWAWWNTYGAWLTQCKDSDLTIRGRHFLVVTVHEFETPCEECHWVVLGVIDLDHRNRAQSIRMRGRLDTLTEPVASTSEAVAAPTLVLRTSIGNGFNGGLLEERVKLLDGKKPTFRLEASEEEIVKSWGN